MCVALPCPRPADCPPPLADLADLAESQSGPDAPAAVGGPVTAGGRVTPLAHRAGPVEPPAGAVDPDAYRAVFRRHAAGVSVVTLGGPAGPVGFTATSLVSLSLDPPLVSLSIAARSSSWPALRGAETFVAHLLSHDSSHVADLFATSGADRFGAATRWTRLPTGEPLLAEAAAWLRCRVEHRIPAGDHHLVVARVLTAHTVRQAAPLLYHDGRYATLADDERPADGRLP